MPNSQVGRPVITRRPPLFAHLTIRGGTYTETDRTKTQLEPNADEETFNVTAYDRGDDVKFEAFPDIGYEPNVNDVLTEIWNPANGTQPNNWVARAWVVTKIERKQFGKRALIFAMEAIRSDALDTSQVTP